MINQLPPQNHLPVEFCNLCFSTSNYFKGICVANTDRIIPREVNGPSFRGAEAPVLQTKILPSHPAPDKFRGESNTEQAEG